MPDLVVPDLGTPTPVVPTETCDTTLATAISRTRRELLRGRREEINKLDGAINDSVDELDVTYAVGGIQAGAQITVDFEHMYVWSVDGKTATVERGHNGTTAAAHSDGSIVYVNSRQSDDDIRNAINDTLKELSSPGGGLFAVYALELAYDPNVVAYDLDGVTALYDLIDVYWKVPSDELKWARVNRRGWRLQRDANTTDFPSGFGLTFFSRLGLNEGDTIRVTYKGPYTELTDYTDNVQSTTGLHCQAHDLLWIGAAIRLTDSREIERNQTQSQGEPRRANEVPAGAVGNSVAGLQRRWNQRLSSEAGRLSRDYPTYIR